MQQQMARSNSIQKPSVPVAAPSHKPDGILDGERRSENKDGVVIGAQAPNPLDKRSRQSTAQPKSVYGNEMVCYFKLAMFSLF